MGIKDSKWDMPRINARTEIPHEVWFRRTALTQNIIETDTRRYPKIIVRRIMLDIFKDHIILYNYPP